MRQEVSDAGGGQPLMGFPQALAAGREDTIQRNEDPNDCQPNDGASASFTSGRRLVRLEVEEIEDEFGGRDEVGNKDNDKST